MNPTSAPPIVQRDKADSLITEDLLSEADGEIDETIVGVLLAFRFDDPIRVIKVFRRVFLTMSNRAPRYRYSDRIFFCSSGLMSFSVLAGGPG